MKILVCALESSSNIHLEALLKELPKDVELVGIYDKKFGNPTYDITELAIMGFIDVLKKLRFFFKLKKQMASLSKEVDKVLLMDSSGFNLPLAKAIKKLDPKKEIIYYILPQAWAWKKGRIPKIEQYCDKLCSILPFESDYYTKKEKISYVGHPLLDEIQHFKQSTSSNNKVAFMPGSRKGEIIRLLPIYKKIATQLNKKPILIIPQKFSQKYIDEVYGDISEFEISNNTHKTLQEVDFAFICSGTATLEAALIGTPFVLSYIANKIDYFIGSRLVKLEFVGLANIFFSKMGKKPIHKEFLQEDVNVENLLQEYQNLDRKKFLENSKILRKYLQHGSSKNVAKILTEGSTPL